MNIKTKGLMIVFNPFSWFTKLGKAKNGEREQALKIWEEIEQCDKAYKHKKSLGDKLLAQADGVDKMNLPFAEKIGRRRMYLNAAKNNFDQADNYNQKVTDLSAELRMIIKNIGGEKDG